MPQFLPFSCSGIAVTNLIQGVLNVILHRMKVFCCVDKLDRENFGHSVQSSPCAKLSLVISNLVFIMLTLYKNSKIRN